MPFFCSSRKIEYAVTLHNYYLPKVVHVVGPGSLWSFPPVGDEVVVQRLRCCLAAPLARGFLP